MRAVVVPGDRVIAVGAYPAPRTSSGSRPVGPGPADRRVMMGATLPTRRGVTGPRRKSFVAVGNRSVIVDAQQPEPDEVETTTPEIESDPAPAEYILSADAYECTARRTKTAPAQADSSTDDEARPDGDTAAGRDA